MAHLKERSSSATRLVFERGGVSPAALIGLIVFGAMVALGLCDAFDSGIDIGAIITVFIVGLGALGTITGAARRVRVVVDGDQRRAERREWFFFVPTKHQELAFNSIRNIHIAWDGLKGQPPNLAGANWNIVLTGVDSSTLVVNERGAHEEMEALAQKLASLVGAKIVDDYRPTAVEMEPTPVSKSAAAMTSLSATLDSLTTTLASSPAAPSESRVASQTRRSETATQKVSGVPAESVLQASSAEASGRLFERAVLGDQAPHSSGMTPAASAPSYVSQPILSMPELPPLFAPTSGMDMPSLPPLGGSLSEYIPGGETITPVNVPAPTAPTAAPRTELPRSEPSVSKDTEDAETWHKSGLKSYRAGDYEQALNAFTQALRLDPANAALQNDLGVIYLQRRDLRAAEAAFRRAVALDPFAAASRYNLALTLALRGAEAEAFEHFTLGARNSSGAEQKRFANALNGILDEPQLSK